MCITSEFCLFLLFSAEAMAAKAQQELSRRAGGAPQNPAAGQPTPQQPAQGAPAQQYRGSPAPQTQQQVRSDLRLTLVGSRVLLSYCMDFTTP